MPLKAQRNPKISPVKESLLPHIIKGSDFLKYPPVVVGTGPAGLFAALFLARNGYKPLLLERGKEVDERGKDVARFWDTGQLDPESNVQFGEGGAGTFSDGKLTTRIKDKRKRLVIKYLLEAGAPEEIAYEAKPHLGTDNLRKIVKNLRQKIIEAGGRVLFRWKVTDVIIEKGRLKGIEINNSFTLPANVVILAIGHSARDTYRLLFERGVRLQAKPFAIGLRIEHPQNLIDISQYGKFAGHPRLGAADYRLTYRDEKIGRSVFSFCMCPGGYVIGASSEPEHLVTNGMSNFKRDSGIANSAVVVNVGKGDFSYENPLAGMEFQRKWEKRAFELGGKDYSAPVQTVEDFIKGAESSSLPDGPYTYRPGVKAVNLRKCLPEEIASVLRDALKKWDTKIKGFAGNGAVLTGVETRTSAPVRILRDEKMQAVELEGLYPAGEGAGYAGGIMSAAVDGLKVAQAVMERFGEPAEEYSLKEE